MQTSRFLASAAAALIAAAAGSAATAWAQDAAHPARALLQDPEGKQVGSVALTETPNGLLLQLEAEGLPAGTHGFHLHETGACEAPDFKSAGGHFAPRGNKHGYLSEGGPHAGDLPNIYSEGGRTRADAFADGLTLDGDNGLLDDDGAAVVIHATADDYETDPAGHAGDRIACGVIERPEAQ